MLLIILYVFFHSEEGERKRQGKKERCQKHISCSEIDENEGRGKNSASFPIVCVYVFRFQVTPAAFNSRVKRGRKPARHAERIHVSLFINNSYDQEEEQGSKVVEGNPS